jgi:hypothetical protein
MLAFALALTLAGAAAQAPAPATNLRTEYMTNPNLIGPLPPRFSWLPQSAARGDAQSAYQLQVWAQGAPPGAPPVWDSGRVASSAFSQVVFGGPPLAPDSRFLWNVSWYNAAGARAPTWDNANPLTNGVLLEPDARVDLVLYRNGAGEGAAPRLALQPLGAALVMNEAPVCSDHFGVQVRFACLSSSVGAGARRVEEEAEEEEEKGALLLKGSWRGSSGSFGSSSSGSADSPRARNVSSRASSCSDCTSMDVSFLSSAAPSPTNDG